MNICLKILFLIFITASQQGNAQSLENSLSMASDMENPDMENPDMENLCYEVGHGELSLLQVQGKVQKMSPLDMSYLFECSLTIIIPWPGETENSKSVKIQNRTKRKVEIASFFINKGVDVNYKDETGSNLLVAVTISEIPEKWKIKFIKILISKGCDANENSKEGYSALELAKYKKDLKVIEALSGR